MVIGIPAEVAQGDETRAIVAARHRVLSVARGQGHAFDQDPAVPEVEVEEPRQFGKLVVAQQPGVAVEFRGEDQGAVEGVQDKVVLPEVETRREADPAVLGEPSRPGGKPRSSAPARLWVAVPRLAMCTSM